MRTLNPSVHIGLDPSPVLWVRNGASYRSEPITAADQLDAVYTLASLPNGELDGFVRQELADAPEVVDDLQNAGLLVEDATDDVVAPDVDYAFRLTSYAEMLRHAEAAPVRRRDEVYIVDHVFPEEARFSVDVWARQIPFRRIDVDRSDVGDLHWIFRMSPPATCVRSLPFLRALDEKVRSVVNLEGKVILRAHVYVGTSADVYHAHMDTDSKTDITAIYYPAKWEDHFGGELLFYEEGEPRWAVAVRTGRLIIFHGAVQHRIAPVSSAANKARCSLVVRYGELAD